MSGNNIYPSLCSTCKHASTCTYSRNPKMPSFYCEEFEIETVPQVKSSDSDKQQSAEYHIARQEDAALLPGLCSDCRNRDNCAFPKPEGGIWHCEEYQ